MSFFMEKNIKLIKKVVAIVAKMVYYVHMSGEINHFVVIRVGEFHVYRRTNSKN